VGIIKGIHGPIIKSPRFPNKKKIKIKNKNKKNKK
jgi:hypothetical protein